MENWNVITPDRYEDQCTQIYLSFCKRPQFGKLVLACLRVCMHSSLDAGSGKQSSTTLSSAAHALKCTKYCLCTLLKLLTSHLLWDSSGIRQARADMWNLCHLLNCSVTMNWAALPVLAWRNKWQGLGWHMLMEWGQSLSLRVAGWHSLEGGHRALLWSLRVSRGPSQTGLWRLMLPLSPERRSPWVTRCQGCFEGSWSGSEGAWMMAEMTGWLDKSLPESRAAKLPN